MDSLKKKSRRGRKAIPYELRRKSFSTMFDPNFLNNLKTYCTENEISQGKALEICFKEATNNFQDNISRIM